MLRRLPWRRLSMAAMFSTLMPRMYLLQAPCSLTETPTHLSGLVRAALPPLHRRIAAFFRRHLDVACPTPVGT